MVGKRRSSVKSKSSIEGYFNKSDSNSAVVPDDNGKENKPESPDKTSDYGSEPASRCQTPTSIASSPDKPVKEEEMENRPEVSLDTSVVIPKREVNTDQDNEDVEGVDMFSELKNDIKEEDTESKEDKEGIKAAILAGLITADAADEEERIAAETKRRAGQEEAMRKQDAAKESKDISAKMRYERLQKLLGKSKFYTDFLLNKMKGHEAAMKLKAETNVARAKKRAEKEEEQSEDTRRTGRNKEVVSEPTSKGRKSKGTVNEANGGTGKKRKIGETGDVEEVKDAKKPKTEKEANRKFEGRDIPVNQPLLVTGGIMRSYQIEGYEWMASLWENGINGILADEMGLGKTIQTVALFCHLYEMGVNGPFLVIGPLSTVPNWVNEFKRFAPNVPCILYHGNQAERETLRERLNDVTTCDELDGKKMMNVVVTSYEIAINDRAAFQNIMWRYIVVDEGHRLKNSNCRLIKELKQYHSANRLLLTGTPLQNNLSELWSLLNFLLPEIFDDLRVFESWFDAKEIHVNDNEKARVVAQEMQNSILSTLHQILTPFLLRRVKTDVDLDIPPKKEVLVYCPLTDRQNELYKAILERTIADLLKDDTVKEEILPEKRKTNAVNYAMFLDDEKEIEDDDKFEEQLSKMSEMLSTVQTGKSAYTNDIEKLRGNEKNYCVKSRMMDMRKAVNHPYLIEYPVSECGTFYNSSEDMIYICGKLHVFHQMLERLMAGGHKTLVFSQMTKMLDILGDYLNLKKIKFCRLDGSMNFLDRQANIDKFNTDPEHKVFLLSTRAGGLGINLTAADTCIIYDSDWNPQQDLQAQDRCHRIGQTKPVMVYRMVTANTVDQSIVERAAAKRKLEKMVIHKEKFKAGAESINTSLKTISPTELLRLLNSKDHVGEVSADNGMSEEQLDQLLDRSDLAWGDHKPVHDTVKAVKGVFRVIDQDEKKVDLGSVKE